jgi:hypothetical protein
MQRQHLREGLFFVLVASLLLAAPRPSSAEPSPVVGKLRLSVPYASISSPASSEGEGASIFGGSLALETLGIVVIEGGAHHFHSFSGGFSGDLFGRGGVVLTVMDLRDDEHEGWQVQAGGALGYRFVQFAKESARVDLHEASHCLTAGVSLEATYWLYRHLGFNARLFAGGSFPLAQSRNLAWERGHADLGPQGETDHLFDINLALGLAL